MKKQRWPTGIEMQCHGGIFNERKGLTGTAEDFLSWSLLIWLENGSYQKPKIIGVMSAPHITPFLFLIFGFL